MLSLEQFNQYITDLSQHDWHYEYSDDAAVYRKGQTQRLQLSGPTQRDPMFCRAFELYQLWSNGEISPQLRDLEINQMRTTLLITT